MRNLARRPEVAGGSMGRIPPPPPRRVPQLESEIIAFANHMMETPADVQKREETIARCEEVVRELAPDAQVHLFGSCVTGLRLPHGDVDLMIEAPKWLNKEKKLLFKLAEAIKKPSIARRVLPLAHAKVPILKWSDKQTRISVDACINRVDALKTTALLARSAATLPALRPLALVLKSQMRLHHLHETRTGGIGSYLLAHMIRHVLLLPPPPPRLPGHARRRRAAQLAAASEEEDVADAAGEEDEDLGGRLLRFYWYYGFALDTSSSVVMLNGEATKVATTGRQGYLDHAPTALSLNDPATPASDIGAKAFRFASVRSLIRLSYKQLMNRIDLANTEPSQRHVPKWLKKKRKKEAAQLEAAADGGTGAPAAEAPAAESDPAILSAVLPKWQRGWSKRAARIEQGKLDMLSQLRREEEVKLDEATAEIAVDLREMELGGAQSRDPLWEVSN